MSTSARRKFEENLKENAIVIDEKGQQKWQTNKNAHYTTTTIVPYFNLLKDGRTDGTMHKPTRPQKQSSKKKTAPSCCLKVLILQFRVKNC